MSPRQSKQTGGLGEVLDVLSHPHRRRILTRLNARNPRDEAEFELDAFAAEIDLDGEMTTLVHVHLPKLADTGFINWNREHRLVTRGPRFDEIAPLIDLMVAHQDELPAEWL